MAKKEQEQAVVQPRIRMKGFGEFRHDLFKAEVAVMKRNISFERFSPQIVTIEHCHFFHSHDNRGRAQLRTTAQGGHFHEIKMSVDKEGNLVAKCGPAMREITKLGKNKKPKKVIEQIKYETGDDEPIVDDHTHQMTYLHSEHLSEAKIQQMRKGTQQALARMAVDAGYKAHTATQQSQEGGDDGAGNSDGPTLEDTSTE